MSPRSSTRGASSLPCVVGRRSPAPRSSSPDRGAVDSQLVRQTGLAEVNPPDPYETRRTYPKGQLLAIARQLKKGVWVTDSADYPTRAAAYARAQTLCTALLREGFAGDLQRKTWTDPDSTQLRWAVRERK